jgi:hypothetical protein
MLFGDEGEADPSRLPPSVPATDATEVSRHRPEIASPPLFHPLAYRGVVAEWPIEFREQWGRRANALEESGLSWRDAETQAFVVVWKLVRHRHPAQSTGPALATGRAERN